MRKQKVVGRIYGMNTVEKAIKTETDTRTEKERKTNEQAWLVSTSPPGKVESEGTYHDNESATYW